MKTELAVMTASSARELIDMVNKYNKENTDTPILQDDIKSIILDHDNYSFFLFYYK